MELFNLTNKTALITGASSVLENNSHAFFLAKEYGVILASRRLDKLQTLSSELNNAVALEMDVADKTSLQRAFDRLEQQR